MAISDAHYSHGKLGSLLVAAGAFQGLSSSVLHCRAHLSFTFLHNTQPTERKLWHELIEQQAVFEWLREHYPELLLSAEIDHNWVCRLSHSKYPFTFGVEKAKKILAALPQIQAFVQQNAPARPDTVDIAYEDLASAQRGLKHHKQL